MEVVNSTKMKEYITCNTRQDGLAGERVFNYFFLTNRNGWRAKGRNNEEQQQAKKNGRSGFLSLNKMTNTCMSGRLSLTGSNTTLIFIHVQPGFGPYTKLY